jgi:glucose/arabinose dehydrogenase
MLARALALALAVLGGGCSAGEGLGEVPGAATGSASAGGGGGSSPVPSERVAPRLSVEVVTRGLEHGWDVGFLPDGRVLLTERPGRLTLLSAATPGAGVTRVAADLSEVYAVGEGGLLGMVIHPDFADSGLFTTCLDHAENGVPVDIRLVTWRLSADGRRAERVKNLLTGLPVAVGGRHSGCRLAIAADGALLVGTGDTARGNVPQDRGSLGGKVLRLNLQTGEPMPDNPFVDSTIVAERYVYSYGHRNIQGVAVRPGTGQIFTAEHGPSVNEEVNLVQPGANYGWDPARGGTGTGYDESVPMTDTDRYPDAVVAVWQSGQTTQAICSATFLDGRQWDEFDGVLVVTALKGAKLLFLTLDEAGAVTAVSIPSETDGPFGRLRASRQGPDGALYVTTTNGEDDALLRITLS